MRQEDKKAQQAYLEKLMRAKATGLKINPSESLTEKMDRIHKAKGDVLFFVQTYLTHYATVDSADFQLEFAYMVKNNPVFKGYAEWGRGLAKSVWSDVIIPLWLWINKESSYMCIVSDTFDRACDLLEDIRAEFEANELLIHDFGEQFNQGNWEKGNFCTKNGFIGKAFGAKQKVRGLRKGARRPDLWIIDDLETSQTIKNSKMQDDYAKWIESDVIPTMTEKNRRVIGANNRFAGRMVQTILKERHPEWTWHLIEAYNPVTYQPRWSAMYTAEYYKQQEKDMGIIAAHSEYNHVPFIEGKIFKPEQIKYGKLPDLHSMNAIIAHWDIAYAGNATSDFNAVKIWGRHLKDFWLIAGFVKQSKMRLAVEWMCMKQKEFKAQGITVIWQYEAQFWNDEVQRVIDEVEAEQKESLNLIKVIRPKIAKFFLLLSMQPYYQNGRIYHNEELKSDPDYQEGNKQLFGIEPGYTYHDDSPDADEQAVKKLELYNDTPAEDKKEEPKAWRTGKVKRKYSF